VRYAFLYHLNAYSCIDSLPWTAADWQRLRIGFTPPRIRVNFRLRERAVAVKPPAEDAANREHSRDH